MIDKLFKRYWNPPGEARTIRMTSDQVLTQARKEAHTYSHSRLREEIMGWIDTIMTTDIPDRELQKVVNIINTYYAAGKRKGTNFQKMPGRYMVQLAGFIR